MLDLAFFATWAALVVAFAITIDISLQEGDKMFPRLGEAIYWFLDMVNDPISPRVFIRDVGCFSALTASTMLILFSGILPVLGGGLRQMWILVDVYLHLLPFVLAVAPVAVLINRTYFRWDSGRFTVWLE